MDYNSNKETVCIGETVLENKSEQPIEGEFLLADYYGEIVQILKCITSVQMMSKQVLSDKVIMDGYVNLRILYLSPDDNGVNCFEQNISFNKTIDLKESNENHMVEVDATIEYINCRAIDQRHIDVRGAITFETRTIRGRDDEIQVNSSEDSMEQLHNQITLDHLVAVKEKTFTMNEIFPVPCEDMSQLVILRSQQQIQIEDYKCISNKIVAKGELEIEIAYKENKADSIIHHHKHNLPISQIIDVDGVDETCICLLKASVLSCVIDKNTAGDNEFSLSIYGCIHANCYKNKKINTLVDAYSTKYEMTVDTRAINVDTIEKCCKEKHNQRMVIEDFFTEGYVLTDIWYQTTVKETTFTEHQLNVTLLCDICCMMKNDTGNYIFKNRAETTTITQSIENKEQAQCHVFVEREAFNHVQNGTVLEVRGEITVGISVTTRKSITVIDKVQMNKEKEKQNTDDATLTIYYGEKGEGIWDIAKKYNTSVGEILKQNDMENGNLKDRKMLLLPIVR